MYHVSVRNCSYTQYIRTVAPAAGYERKIHAPCRVPQCDTLNNSSNTAVMQYAVDGSSLLETAHQQNVGSRNTEAKPAERMHHT